MIRLCPTEQFVNESSDRRVIAIGAGKRLLAFLSKWNVRIAYAVDNDLQKQGLFIEGFDIQIESWDFLVNNLRKDDLIVITPNKFTDLLEQVQSLDNTEENQLYILDAMERLQYDLDRQKIARVPVSFRQHEMPLIPKIIHFFWFSGDPFPEQVQQCIDSWKRFCPDYEIRKWDLTNYDYSSNRFAREAIEHRKWAFASDFGRADVVFRYGGIYLDTDVELVRSIDDLLYHDAFIGFESSEYIDPGSGFGAAPGNPVIKAFCDIYKDKRFVLDDGQLNTMPCPRYYTSVLDAHGLKRDGSFQLLDGIAVYPYYSFCPHSHVTNKIYMDSDTYSIHHHAGGWMDKTDYPLKELIRQTYVDGETAI